MNATREHHIDDVIGRTPDAAFMADHDEFLAQMDIALAAADDDGERGSLLLQRAIALQGSSDPNRPAADGMRAFELLRTSDRTDEAALAAAITAAMRHRTNDLEQSIDLAVEAMVLIDGCGASPATARAANALAVLFAQLSAFAYALDFSRLAIATSDNQDGPATDAIAATHCYVLIEAHHAGVSLPIAEARLSIDRLRISSADVANQVLGPGMAAELAVIEDPLRAYDIVLDATILDATAPRLRAWYRLVQAEVASARGRHLEALRFLDLAFPELATIGDALRVVRAYRLRSATRARVGDPAGALDDANIAADMLRSQHVEQVGRLSAQISRRAELEMLRARLQEHATDLAGQVDEDALTGVGSRRLLDSYLESIDTADDAVAVVVLDLDRFKSINDRFGHPVGDTVLERVGEILRFVPAPDGVIARTGGEEFVAVFPGANVESALEFSERVRSALDHQCWDDIATDLWVRASAGVADGPTADVRSVIERADAAMYEAKRRGRNRSIAA